MSLKQMIQTRYGTGIHQSLTSFQHLKLKLSSAFNQIVFLECCVHNNLIPQFLRNRFPIKSKHAQNLTSKITKNQFLTLSGPGYFEV
jgi:hypothetical protein